MGDFFTITQIWVIIAWYRGGYIGWRISALPRSDCGYGRVARRATLPAGPATEEVWRLDGPPKPRLPEDDRGEVCDYTGRRIPGAVKVGYRDPGVDVAPGGRFPGVPIPRCHRSRPARYPAAEIRHQHRWAGIAQRS